MARSVVVYVSGMDGSGKSTVASMLEHELRARGVPVVRIWFRFPFLLTLPLLLIARLTGLTRVVRCRGRSLSIHFFRAIALPFTLLFIIDLTIHYLLRIRLRTLLPIVLVVDRGPLDSLMDLAADTERDPGEVILGNYLAKLQSRGLTVLTTASFPVLTKRRADNVCDPKAGTRFMLYSEAFTRILNSVGGSVTVINTERSVERTREAVASIAEAVRREYGHVGWGKKLRNPYLRALLASKWFILANWLLQGSLIADRVENAIRLITDSAALLITYTLTGSMPIALASLAAVHTINYIALSNSPIIWLYLNRSAGIERSITMLEQYIRRRGVSDSIVCIAVFGSLARRAQTKHSDIDMRIARKKGVVNGIKSVAWTASLRVYALTNKIPLDVFITTADKLTKNVRVDERVNVIFLHKKGDECDITNTN